MFNRSEAIALTNTQTDKKQTDAAENIHLAPLWYAGGYQEIQLPKSKIPLRYPASEPARELVRELVCDLLASWLQTS